MTGHPLARVGDFCRTGSGSTPSRSQMGRYYEGGVIPWVKSGELRERLIVETNEHVTDAALRETGVKLVPAGAILLAMYGATVGRLAILGVEATTNQAVCHIVPDSKVADTRYLYRAIAAQVPAIIALGVGGAQPNISQSLVKDLRVPLPPLPEQRRIAAILDEADALRAKRQEAWAQLDSLSQSIFIEMFGDPRENDRDWSKASIGSLISDMRGGASLEPGDFMEVGFPVLHKGAIKPNGGLAFDPKKRPFTVVEYAAARPQNRINRDFIAVTLRDLVPSGPSIGLAADLRFGPFDEYLLAQGAYGFRVDSRKLTGAFLVQLSNMPTFRLVLRQNAVGSTQIHIRTPIYLAIEIPVPPIGLQQAFAARFQAVESLKATHRAALAELDALFASLQHRAFTGQLS